MKKILWFSVCVALMSSLCMAKGDGMQRLQGAWVGDADSALAAQGMDRNTDDPTVKMMVDMMEGMKCSFGEGTMTMEVTMMGDTKTVDGTFEVLEEAENTMKIKNLDGPKAGSVSVITFNDDDHIQVAQEGGRRPPTYMMRAGAAPVAEAAGADVQMSAPPVAEAVSDDAVVAQMMGAWVGDVDAALAAQNLDRSSTDPAAQMLIGMLEGMKCDFEDGTMKLQVAMMGDTQSLEAGYEVLGSDSASVTIRTLDGPKAGKDSVITFTDADHIVVAELGSAAPPTYLMRAVGEAVVEDTSEGEELIRATEPRKEVEFIVIIPEQIDTEWYWYYYTEITQNIVQSQVEKALIRKGLDIIDVNTLSMFRSAGTVDGLLNQADTLERAREAGATYLIMGKATAVMQGRSFAYGVEVIRSKADASARIIRVSDGKVMKVLDAEAEEGGQAQKATGQAALKTAGKKLGRRIANAAFKIKEE